MGLEQIRVELCDSWGTDKNVAHAAWASSYDKEKAEARSEADVARIVTGVVDHHHDTPKERVWFEFFITCPIFVERQFDKYRLTLQYQQFEADHRPALLDRVRDLLIRVNRRIPVMNVAVGVLGRWIVTQNELSGRYRTIPDRPYRLPLDVKQIVGRLTSGSALASDYDTLLSRQHERYQIQLSLLRDAEKRGDITNAEYKRAREVLRGVLGTSFLTDMRIVCNANALEHIINQRLAREAQMESRVVAYYMLEDAMKVAPTMIEQMIKANGWDSLKGEVEAALRAELQ